jgi:predicted transcriptional regulator
MEKKSIGQDEDLARKLAGSTMPTLQMEKGIISERFSTLQRVAHHLKISGL